MKAHHVLTFGLIITTVSAPALAEVVTERFDITSVGLGVFGLSFSSDHFSQIHPGVIRDVRFVGNFITESPLGAIGDAANIGLDFQVPTEGVPIWSFTGADLGWSGTGAFSASISTDMFNGMELLETEPDSFLLYFMRLYNTDDRSPRLGGVFTDSYFEVDIRTTPAPGALGVLGLGGLMGVRRKR